jgi:integrase
MASISTSEKGLRTVQFVAPDGKRRSVRLGKSAMKTAEEVCRRIEYIIEARSSGTAIDPETARWLGCVSEKLHKRLANVGLVAARTKVDSTLEVFVNDYIASRLDVKPRTRLNLKVCAARLIEHFGAARFLAEIKSGEADDFCCWLRTQYAQATASRTIKRARQFFKAAVRKGLITANPFAECKAGHQSNKSRAFFVTREMADKVLAACPDCQWRLLFVLARFGGLRCPSETLNLKWTDVDWERSRIRIHAPKQEHQEDGGERWIPLFPELVPHLKEAFHHKTDDIYVIDRYRDDSVNLRTELKRIICRAGLAPWERPWHNLRATRQTELAGEFPLHVVCSWIGNKQAVAAEHYLQVTDADFERGAKSGAVAVQFPMQQAAAPNGKELKKTRNSSKKTGSLPELATSCNVQQNCRLPPAGLEPATGGLENRCSIL